MLYISWLLQCTFNLSSYPSQVHSTASSLWQTMTAHMQVRLPGTKTCDKFQMWIFSLCKYFMNKTMLCCLKLGTDLHTQCSQNGTGQRNIEEPTEMHLHKPHKQSPGINSCYNIKKPMINLLPLRTGK